MRASRGRHTAKPAGLTRRAWTGGPRPLLVWPRWWRCVPRPPQGHTAVLPRHGTPLGEQCGQHQDEQHRPDQLHERRPPVDAVRLPAEKPPPLRHLDTWRYAGRVCHLQVQQAGRRGEEQRPHEEGDAVGGDPYGVDEAGRGPQREAQRPAGEQDADPPPDGAGSPPRRPLPGIEQRVPLPLLTRGPRDDGTVRSQEGLAGDERTRPRSGDTGPPPGDGQRRGPRGTDRRRVAGI